MARKAKTHLSAPSTDRTPIQIDPRIALGMFFTLTGTILFALGISTRGHVDFYQKSLGIDANLWWGLALLIFGIIMIALGRRGQAKMEK